MSEDTAVLKKRIAELEKISAKYNDLLDVWKNTAETLSDIKDYIGFGIEPTSEIIPRLMERDADLKAAEGRVDDSILKVKEIEEIFGDRWNQPDEMVGLTTSGRAMLKVKELQTILEEKGRSRTAHRGVVADQVEHPIPFHSF